MQVAGHLEPSNAQGGMVEDHLHSSSTLPFWPLRGALELVCMSGRAHRSTRDLLEAKVSRFDAPRPSLATRDS